MKRRFTYTETRYFKGYEYCHHSSRGALLRKVNLASRLNVLHCMPSPATFPMLMFLF